MKRRKITALQLLKSEGEMLIKKKLETFAGIAPAIAILLCVCMALSGYTEPTYSIDNIEKQKTPETKALKTLSVNIPEEKAKTLAAVEEPAAYKDGTYYGSAMGYNGLIKVKVVIKDGKISSIEIVNHIDDQPYLNNAKNSIIPAIIKGQTTNVDTVSGATFSSNGIIEAVRNALAKAAATEDGKKASEGKSSQSAQEPVVIPGPSDEEGIETPENFIYKDGEYTNDTNMVLCEHPRDNSWAYYLSVKVTIKDGKIAAVEESKKKGKTGEYSKQNDSYLKRAFKGLGSRKGMEAKIIEAQGTSGVDTVTGATISSNSIIQSVNRILPTIEKIPIEDDEITDDEDIADGDDTGEDINPSEPDEGANEDVVKEDDALPDEEAGEPAEEDNSHADTDMPVVKEENDITETEGNMENGEVPD